MSPARLCPVNLHPVERVLRAIVGLAIASLAFVGPQSTLALLGLIPVVTAMVGSCPLYAIFGVSTCAVKPTTAAR